MIKLGCSMLHTCSTPFTLGETEENKKARYNLRKSIRIAKRHYSLRLERYYTTADSRRMWQGLQHITEYRQRSQGAMTSKITLSNEMEFYAGFKAPNINQPWCSPTLRPPQLCLFQRKNTVTCLTDYSTIALTLIIMKCFERIVIANIKRTILATLDPFQFAYRQNRSTDVNAAIHTALTHLG